MNEIMNSVRRIAFGSMLACLPFLGGCGDNTITWQEEVKLLDGRVITVTQKRQYEKVYSGNDIGKIPREAWVTLRLQEFGNKEIIWHENLKPHVLNIYQGSLYMIATPPSGREFIQYGRPKPGYVEYKYDGMKWQRIRFNEVPEAIYDTNLLTANAPNARSGLVSLSDKIVEMKDDRIPSTDKRLNPKWIID
jgi:hypothetical protein